MGGATLSIEAVRDPRAGSRGFKLTGQLGRRDEGIRRDRLQLCPGHARELGVDSGYFDKAFIHLHVPAGATPKDGPSAGITMASALLSLARDDRCGASP